MQMLPCSSAALLPVTSAHLLVSLVEFLRCPRVGGVLFLPRRASFRVHLAPSQVGLGLHLAPVGSPLCFRC